MHLFGEKLNSLSQSKSDEYRMGVEGIYLPRIRGNFNLKSETAILLPTYCEAENIKKIIDEIEKLDLNCIILVIDDSSPDGTAQRVAELQRKYDNIILYERPRKMGLGSAITDGFKFLLSLPHPPKYIITMDADFSHNPKDIPRLLHFAKKGYDLTVGSRYCRGGGVRKWSLIRMIISRTANLLASIILKTSLQDCTSGFRCYSRKLLTKIINNLNSQTYEIQIETIRQASKKGFHLTEIPITFTSRKTGKSKLTLNEIKEFASYILLAKFEDYMKIILPEWRLAKLTSIEKENLLDMYISNITRSMR